MIVTSFITIDKLCIASFEAAINATFSSGAMLKFPSNIKSYGTYHFVFELGDTAKHAWIMDNDNTVYIQDGAEKIGNIRGSVVFLIR